MNAIVRSESSGLMQADVSSELPAIFQLAEHLIQAGGFLPPHLKVVGEVVAVVLAGRELGLPPMVSVRSIKLVKGNVTLDAALQLALMIRAGIKYEWLKDGSDGNEAALEVSRPGQKSYVSTFRIADAQRAGLVKDGSNWKMYPQAMLRARAVSSAGKAYCPDILAGVYVPGELGDEATVDPMQLERPKTLQLSESTRAAEVAQARPAEAAVTVTATTIPTHTQTPTTGPSGEPSSTATTEPTKAERLAVLLEQRLPTAKTLEHFVEIGRELLSLHGPVRSSKGWRMFRDACASFEVPPGDAIRLAQAPVEQAAQ